MERAVCSVTAIGSENCWLETGGIEGEETGSICAGLTVTTTGGAMGCEVRRLSGMVARRAVASTGGGSWWT